MGDATNQNGIGILRRRKISSYISVFRNMNIFKIVKMDKFLQLQNDLNSTMQNNAFPILKRNKFLQYSFFKLGKSLRKDVTDPIHSSQIDPVKD